MPKYVPIELQIKIMKGLPIKSLLKFRSVSKPWKSIIGSSDFITAYNNSHSLIHYQILLCINYDKRFVYIIDNDDDSFSQNKSVHELPLKKRYNHMIGYSQGLFGFYDYNYPNDEAVAVIWNPSIRKSVDIPVPNVLRWPYKTELGFGVCNATDPMIVKINYIDSNYFETISSIPPQAEVYKLSTGKWITLSDTCRLLRKPLVFIRKVIVTERFIYWLVYDRACAVNGLKYLILSFDLISGLSFANDFVRLELSKVGESLVVVEDDRRAPKREASVWMMVMEDGGQNSFKKLYTIKAPNASMQKVGGFRKNGQPIINTDCASSEQDILVVYEPGYEHLKDIWFSIIVYDGVKRSYIYTGTLITEMVYKLYLEVTDYLNRKAIVWRFNCSSSAG